MSRPHVIESDVVVIGAGVAGLSAALSLSAGRIALLTKAELGHGGSSPWAQGGIAAAVGADDSPALHTEDTLVAGAGLAVRDVVDVLTHEGPAAIDRLLELGARFDRTDDGQLALGREAAHQRRRILHARGDATGAEVVRALTAAVLDPARAPGVSIHARSFASALLLEGDRVIGVQAIDADGATVVHQAPAVVLASGGSGQLFSHTTNPPEATADGLAMAIRAGARVCDVEFVQFHPTALRAPGRDPLPLLTEALRGEGAVLVNDLGVRFMAALHADAELAPRDIVARGIWSELEAGRGVYLDARRAVGDAFPTRFPTVWRLCQESGLDPRNQPLPVAPAAHYHMGGVDVDADGRTSVPGLWACGEVAATGVHGANRLASNSLLEGLVFGARVASSVSRSTLDVAISRAASDRLRPARGVRSADAALEARLRELLRRTMWQRVGLIRSAEGLTEALATLDAIAGQVPGDAGELSNMVVAARAIAVAAQARCESRGGHYRLDHPRTDPLLRNRQRFQPSAATAGHAP